MPDRDLPEISTPEPPSQSKSHANIKGWAMVIAAWIVTLSIGGGIVALTEFWHEHLPDWEVPAIITTLIALAAFAIVYARAPRFQLANTIISIFLIFFGICLAIFHGWGGYAFLLVVITIIANLVSTSRRAALVDRAQKHLDQAISQINAAHRMLGKPTEPDQTDEHRKRR